MNTRHRPVSPEALTRHANLGTYRHVNLARAVEAEARYVAYVRRFEAPYWTPLAGKGDGKRDNHPVEN